MKEDIIESTDKQDKGEISNNDNDDNDKDDNGCSVDSRRPDHTPKINTDCTEKPSSSLLPSLPKSKTKQKRRSKIVSFTEEVLSRDHSGDGTNVVVKEEQGVFLGPFLGRVTMSSASNDDNHNNDNDNDNDNDNTPDAVSTSTWLSPSSPLALSPECGSEHGGNGGGSEGCAERVTFDNLVVRMGLLKCGHRYRLVIPVPGSSDDSESKSKSKSKNRRRKLAARIIEQSIDGDLKGEIETERQDGCTAPRVANDGDHDDDDDDDDDHDWNPSNKYEPCASSPSPCEYQHQDEQYCLKITLSASRRGPYRGRFAMELLSCNSDADVPEQHQQQHQQQQHCPQTVLATGDDRARFDATTTTTTTTTTTATTATTATTRKAETETETSPTKKCIMSIQVDATIMGKDMGTPKLRNGVVCLGKMVGYDSDDDTEWQGFD